MFQVLSSNFERLLTRLGPVPVQFLGVSDIEEAFNNTNDRYLTIEIEILGVAEEGKNTLKKVIFETNKSSNPIWVFSAFSDTFPTEDIALHNKANTALLMREGVFRTEEYAYGIDCRDFIDLINIILNARYYASFRNVINVGGGDHFDLRVGTAFTDLWGHMENQWEQIFRQDD